VLERRQYQERPPRFEYELTEKGRDFYPVLLVIVRWGDRWLYAGEEPPVMLRHTNCGEITHGELVCAQCREPLQHEDIRAELADGGACDLDARIAAAQSLAPARPTKAQSSKRKRVSK